MAASSQSLRKRGHGERGQGRGQLRAADFQVEASKRARRAATTRMKLRWKTGLRWCWFKMQWTEGPIDREGWRGDMVSTRGRAMVEGLKIGVPCSFRVPAHHANGASDSVRAVIARMNQAGGVAGRQGRAPEFHLFFLPSREHNSA